MLELKEAVKQSLAGFIDLFPEEKDHELRLEEAVLTEDKSRWKITVSTPNPTYQDQIDKSEAEFTGVAAIFRPRIEARLYKTLLVTAEDGRFVGFKNDWDISS